jgi:LacI family transcriptional regulator
VNALGGWLMANNEGKNRVTQHDVAQRAGVSRAVVSYVLNDGPRGVSDETRQRVLSAMQDLDYHPNRHAQRLKQGSEASRNSIGIVAGGQSYNVLKRPYYNEVLAGLFDSAYEFDQHIRFLSFFNALKDPVFFSKTINPDEISALILILPSLIMATADHEAILDRMIDRIENIVCLEESIKNLPAVIFDRVAAARLAVEHLISLGHRQIAHLAIDDQREQGYREALLEHNLPYDATLVRHIASVEPSASAYPLAQALFEIPPRPTALFTANDESAIGAIAALKDIGLRVPEDVAVISIDDIELASMVRPALTTVHVPKSSLGRHAVQFLLSPGQFSNQSSASIVAPIELSIRESCGARMRNTAH